ncbi:MAG: hypothetical protein U1E63_13500 [Burkholderiales bacterium]
MEIVMRFPSYVVSLAVASGMPFTRISTSCPGCKAAARLSSQGHLIILSPAHQGLYSPFDAAIGHYRRYNRTTLAGLNQRANLKPVSIFYLDSVGLAASFANRALLKSSMPTPAQVHVWDRLMVRLSRIVDPFLLYSVGKTIVGVWQKP